MEAIFTGPGPAFAAAHMSFIYGDEFVEVVPITMSELHPSSAEWFVQREGKGWNESEYWLDEPGVIIFVGAPGTGRGSAALHRLRQRCPEGQLMKLEPRWERPQTRLLPPAAPNFGYLLDLSEHRVRPDADFGKKLRDWAIASGAYLAVLATETVLNDEWIRPLTDRIVRLRTANGRELAAKELRAAGQSSLVERLDEDAFAKIWDPSPPVGETLRFISILQANPGADGKTIADEFLGWKGWFDNDCPAGFEPRTLVWSAAMCDGGLTTSVLAMAEALRTQFQEKDRSLADIFGEDFPSKRLKDANLTEEDDRVHLPAEYHGLAVAVRLHLWQQFAGYRDDLIKWAVGQAAELAVEEDARRVVTALMDVAVHFRLHSLVQKLFDALATKRPKLLIEALSSAALDPMFGAYIRDRLYAWPARGTQEVIDIVADVCGGDFGQEKPSMAITRLGRAALKSPNPASPALVTAFTSLATSRHCRVLLKSIWAWLGSTGMERAGISAFLCLASTEKGIRALLNEHNHEVSAEAVSEKVAQAFQQAIAREETYEASLAVMKAWGKATDLLGWDRVVAIFGAAVRPNARGNIIYDLQKAEETQGIIGDVLMYAIQQPRGSVSAAEMEGLDDATVA
ncbi:hypothetical protein AB0I81_20210 [Nonomuraea sp. NPDC050404]|uniref:hypothetical protein n=1 Tax=Nonomuraea sp. NPDC050404 TaxID=3155783 RepID=UPI0033C37E83